MFWSKSDVAMLLSAYCPGDHPTSSCAGSHDMPMHLRTLSPNWSTMVAYSTYIQRGKCARNVSIKRTVSPILAVFPAKVFVCTLVLAKPSLWVLGIRMEDDAYCSNLSSRQIHSSNTSDLHIGPSSSWIISFLSKYPGKGQCINKIKKHVVISFSTSVDLKNILKEKKVIQCFVVALPYILFARRSSGWLAPPRIQ